LLAYLLWHRPADGIEQEAYERASEGFHRSLHHAPPAGFWGSAVFRVDELTWLDGGGHGLDGGAGEPGGSAVDMPAGTAGERDGRAGYEDWYLVDDFAALGVLNEVAVAHGHRTAHDEVARRFGTGAGGLYGLMEGRADLGSTPLGIWVSRPPGAAKPALAGLLGDGLDPQHSSLWRRSLVFGPAPEYCLLAHEPPAGIAPGRLPQGWRATITTREEIWNG
jgi:hypothetical protein